MRLLIVARRAEPRTVRVALACLVVLAVSGGIFPSLSGASSAPTEHPRVLRVGSWRGRSGEFSSIQDAVGTARPGDWILVGPGAYHEQADRSGVEGDKAGAGVLITTPGVHLRGMDRNRVVVDGTKPGSQTCDASATSQDSGPDRSDGQARGRNGIEVLEVDGVTVENLTVCNFLAGASGGNEIWFNGGDGSGTTNMGAFRGAYLSAASTFYGGSNAPMAQYGLFASNVHGPGRFDHTYAANMADASYYVGACPDCNTTISDAHAQNSALGYSGTNSGGHLTLEHSEWDHNKAGIVTNSQNNDDAPSPQDGACPTARSGSCTVFRDNYVHENNNPNVPQSGTAALGPVGTGVVIAGGRNDQVRNNRVTNNGAWGILVVPFPDTDTPPPIAHCEGGTASPGLCFFDAWGNEIAGNQLDHNGSFANATNGDLADLSARHDPGNCWHTNRTPNGRVTTAPERLQQTNAGCGVPSAGADLSSPLSQQVICNTEVGGPCADQPGHHYPRTTTVQIIPLTPQRTMPDPCSGVPANPWCSKP
jgi:hypothetical protein